VGASASVQPADASAEVALDRALAFAESARLLRFAWAVHELPEQSPEGTGGEPPRRDVQLLAYRDADHRVRWLELTPLAADVVEHLVSGQTLGDAVQTACAAHGVTPATVLADLARLLADLGARGVVLGARERS
jgi:hypothetical protein